MVALGEKLATGILPNREIERLAKRLKPSSLTQEVSTQVGMSSIGPVMPSTPDLLEGPVSLSDIGWQDIVSSEGPNGNKEPWAKRNELTESRLPKSGCVFSSAVRDRIFHRGPGRYAATK